ncbi:hypothetical protein [Rhizobium mongolense]|uniref:NTP pyrophosphatase (Non-canonical NTP hydrolase) n=2 Tax=Rhizobium mongolense TaxID=57676 RepID=A0ABR6IIG3_9HYPH|nr:hypothetical protein [Rhizobium mongolense]MBB4227657.1 NTP pyrophosphatase (non-canonical NTP hydrolase) [Rhizobium mongolense]TVZ65181.1 hypothetical protein BCL32_5469 [Rhizobium mongolense USDA 1844]
MSAMLSRYLKDFGETKPAAPVVDTDNFADHVFAGFPDIPEEPAVDVKAERREAYGDGYAAATAELTERYELEAQTVALVHQREIEELTARYEEETAAVIARRLDEIAAEVANLVSAATAKAIAPMLTEALAVQAVSSLAALLREAILDGAAGSMTVKGPARLFELLKAEIGERPDLLRHHESDDADLSVEVGDSVLVTRISAWSASLKKVLE